MLSKKILIISNNALSDINSNGRTLKFFFSPEDANKLSQFFIQSDQPDWTVCQSFFRATDGQVLRAFFNRSNAGCVVKKADEEEKQTAPKVKKSKKNSFTMLVRNFVWKRKGWRKNFYNWVTDIKPEIVLLQAGDSPFLYDISVEISKKYGIPLVIYNSEDYYFKKYNYFKNSGFWGIFYPIFRSVLKRSVKKAIKHSALSVYISEDLKQLYDKEFNKNSDYIYTSTKLEPKCKETDEPIFSYLGNLGLNRHLGLIKIAETLRDINQEYKLDVYGKAPSEEIRLALEGCAAIRYHGFVCYNDVTRIIQESMLVFHTESFESFYARDIAYGFSTKVADNLASGTCFVLFAPEHITCAKYLKDNDCAVVIASDEELKTKLFEIINDKELRNYYINNSKAIAKANHNAQKNMEKFSRLIDSLNESQ